MLRNYFIDGQQIKHTIGTHTRFGYFCADTDTIQYDNMEYKSLHDFVFSHYMKFPHLINISFDEWYECVY